MKDYNKDTWKAYKKYARQHDEDVAVANGIAPFLIVGSLIAGAFMWGFSPFIAKAFFVYGLAIFFGRVFSGVHIDNHLDH